MECLDAKAQELSICAHRGLPIAPGATPPIIPIDQSLAGIVARPNQLLVVDRPAERPEHAHPFLRELQVQTYIGVPVAPRQQVWGVVSLRSPRTVPVSAALEGWLEGLGQQISLMLQRRQAEAELRESEQRFRSVIASLAEGIILHDRDGVIVDCNQQAETILGVPRAELIGVDVATMSHGTIRESGSPFPNLDHPALITLQTGKPCLNVVAGVSGPDGAVRWINMNSEPLIQPGEDRPHAVVTSFSDVTEQRRASLELQRLYEQTRQDAQTRADLLQEVNHRVTNNLCSILGLLNTEQSDVSEAGRAEVTVALGHLEQRIRGLLAAHRLLSESHWAPVRLAVLAERIIRDAASAAPSQHEIRVQVHPAILTVSPRQAHNLALILNELTTNSIKYGLRDGAPLRLTVQFVEQPGGFELVYRDDGPGYPPEVLQRQRPGFGLTLLGQLAKESLRGGIQLANERGAVARILVRRESTGRT